MRKISLERWSIPALLVVPLLLSLACSALSGILPAGPQPADVTAQEDMVFGPGPFNLTDPAVGLSDLSGYTATLTVSFDGTNSGKSETWSRKYVMAASKEPAIRQLTIDTSEDGSSAESVLMAEVDGAGYEVTGPEGCTASTVEAGASLGDQLEPASFLNFVIGAAAAGSETVNDVSANHYTFDARALGQQILTQSTGELWVAAEGGYLVKYLLTTKADAGYFGDGVEGTLTWDYELTDVGKLFKLELPTDCPGGMIDAPLLSDASNIVSSPGILSFDSATGLADAAAYYQKEIPNLGWKPQNEADITETKAYMEFRQGDQDLTVFITADGGVTAVNILLQRSQK